MFKSDNRDSSNDNSNVIWVNALYFALAIDRVIREGFLDLQDIKLGKKYIHKLNVDLWSSWSLADSESLYTLKEYFEYNLQTLAINYEWNNTNLNSFDYTLMIIKGIDMN